MYWIFSTYPKLEGGVGKPATYPSNMYIGGCAFLQIQAETSHFFFVTVNSSTLIQTRAWLTEQHKYVSERNLSLKRALLFHRGCNTTADKKWSCTWQQRGCERVTGREVAIPHLRRGVSSVAQNSAKVTRNWHGNLSALGLRGPRSNLQKERSSNLWRGKITLSNSSNNNKRQR